MKSTLIIAMLLLALQVSSQVIIGDEKAASEIIKQANLFSEYVVKSDHKAITAMYTDDGKLFPNQRDIIEGHEGILKYWELPEGVNITHHKLTPGEINVMGDIAYDYGYYEGTTSVEGEEDSSWKGKYVVIWKKIDGQWKIYLDIWNGIGE